MKTLSRVLAAALLAGALMASAMPASAQDNAHVSILHGVPGVTVDVYANGEELLTNFEPGTMASRCRAARISPSWPTWTPMVHPP